MQFTKFHDAKKKKKKKKKPKKNPKKTHSQFKKLISFIRTLQVAELGGNRVKIHYIWKKNRAATKAFCLGYG